MGWLSTCFGCQKERLPRLCSSQKSREHVKTQHRLTPLGSTLGSGRPFLKHGESPKIPYGSHPAYVGNSPNKRLTFPAEATTQVRDFKGEVCQLRSCDIPLPCPVELLQKDESHSSLDGSEESHLDELETSQRQAPEAPLPPLSSVSDTDEKTQGGQAGVNAVQQIHPATLVLPVPKSPGFIMLPRKRRLGFVWQEPLSPVPEDESSICSEEEEQGLNRDSSASPVDVVESGELNEGSEMEIAPVQCSSPLITRKANEKRSKRIGQAPVEKENMFMEVVATETSGSGREKQPSVLTPVGNIMQWRELKGEHVKTKTTQRDELDETDEVVEDTAFFKEMQETYSDITPHHRPSFGWESDGQGIPNTNTKYREDQQVVWHSTPFEVRLNKALAGWRYED